MIGRLVLAITLLSATAALAQFNRFQPVINSPITVVSTSCTSKLTGSGTGTAILTGSSTGVGKLTCQ